MDIAIGKSKLKKLQKQLLEAQENEHVEEISNLQLQVTEQEKAVALLEEQLAKTVEAAPIAAEANATKPAPAPVNDELKKAKVDVALIGVKLKKLQKQLADTPDDQELKDKITTFEADLKTAQDTVSKLSDSTQTTMSASTTEPKTAISDELKKLKIDAAIAKAAVKKVEKALKKAEEIQAPEIDAIRQQLKEAQQRADELENALANPAATTPKTETIAEVAPNSVDADAAKKRKIDLAIAKAGVKKAEKNIQLLKEQGKDESEIEASEWPKKLIEAQEKLAALEAEESTPVTTSVATHVEGTTEAIAKSQAKAEPEMDLANQIKKEKIAVALAKAQINKLNKRLESAPEDADSINQEITSTEQRLQSAEALLEKLIHSQTNLQENR